MAVSCSFNVIDIESKFLPDKNMLVSSANKTDMTDMPNITLVCEDKLNRFYQNITKQYDKCIFRLHIIE